MPVSRVAAAAVVVGSVTFAPLGGVFEPVALAASTPTPASRTTTPDDASTSGADSYILPDNADAVADANAAAFYGRYDSTSGAAALRRGVFVGSDLTASVATADPRAASQRAGVDVSGGGWLRTGLLLALAILLAAGALSTVFTAPARAALPAGFVGVTAEDVYAGDDAYQAAMFTRQRALGITTVRQVFRWNEIEPHRDVFDYTATDRFVQAAALHGIRVLPVLFGEPDWATARPAGNTVRNTYAPKSAGDFAAFAKAIVKRYGPGGTFWAQNAAIKPFPMLAYQLWTEPNLPIYWGGSVNAAAYANLVKATAPAIRSLQPSAVIISGGLPDSRLGQAPATFLKLFLRAGGGAAITAVGVHPYAGTNAQVYKLTLKMRTTLNRFTGGKKIGLYVTEIGWAVGGPKAKNRTVSAKRQASLVPAMYKTLARHRAKLKLRGVVYFAWRSLQPYPGRTDFWGLRTGLLDMNGNNMPVVATLTKTLKGLK
ncbi:MAG: hypothetical protein AAGC46_13120 [Solirubrobacteraceae bacterium]